MLIIKKGFLIICFILSIILLPTYFVSADEEVHNSQSDNPQPKIELMKDVPFKNDFSIGPTKVSYALNQGESVISTLQITSRIEGETQFEVEIEDFVASDDPQKYTNFLGDSKSQFSSKEWFTPSALHFNLKHGERIYLPIKISVPLSAESGDHYSSVFVRVVPRANPQTGLTLSSRVGSLYLLRIGSENIQTSGLLKTLKTDKKVYFSAPINFELNYHNSGDVHLTPTGKVDISNIFGNKVDEIEVSDWIVLRDSSRIQKTTWFPKFAIGRYTATARISRGYENLTDTKDVTFFVFPIKIIATFVTGSIVLGFMIKLILSRFEIRLKKKRANNDSII